MNSFFHCLADFEMAHAEGNETPPLPAPETRPPAPRPVALPDELAPRRGRAQEAPGRPISPSGRVRVPFVRLEDRIARAVRAGASHLGLQPADYRMRKERVAETPGGWRVFLEPKAGPSLPARAAGAEALVFSVLPSTAAGGDVTFAVHLQKRSARVKVGQASGADSQAALDDTCRSALRYVAQGLVR